MTTRLQDLTELLAPDVHPDDLLLIQDASESPPQEKKVAFGAIIERGSNANGEYVRFADGTQICWRAVSVDLESSHNDTQFTLPASFTEPLGAWATGGGVGISNNNSDAIGKSVLRTNTAVWRFYKSGQAGASTSFGIQLIAIGRWK